VVKNCDSSSASQLIKRGVSSKDVEFVLSDPRGFSFFCIWKWCHSNHHKVVSLFN